MPAEAKVIDSVGAPAPSLLSHLNVTVPAAFVVILAEKLTVLGQAPPGTEATATMFVTWKLMGVGVGVGVGVAVFVALGLAVGLDSGLGEASRVGEGVGDGEGEGLFFWLPIKKAPAPITKIRMIKRGMRSLFIPESS